MEKLFFKDKQYTIGADPEVFVSHNGKFSPANGLVKGTKSHPFPVEKGAVQVDGLALEFNIDPAKDFEEFVGNLSRVQEQLLEMIPGYTFMEDVSVEFTKEDIANVPTENLILGCESDFNAYFMAPNMPPNAEAMMRTVGGHIHIGGFEYGGDNIDMEHTAYMASLTRILDEEVGVYSLFWDKDDKRRSMYGQAGSFRPKKYGMEYRTLSNAWLFKPKVIEFIYEGVANSIKRFLDGDLVTNAEVQDIIDYSERDSGFFKNNPKADYVKGLMEA